MASFGYKILNEGNTKIQVNMESSKNGSNLDVVVYVADVGVGLHGMTIRVDVLMKLQRKVDGVWKDIATRTGYATLEPYSASSPMNRTFTSIASSPSPVRVVAQLTFQDETYSGLLTSLPVHYFG